MRKFLGEEEIPFLYRSSDIGWERCVEIRKDGIQFYHILNSRYDCVLVSKGYRTSTGYGCQMFGSHALKNNSYPYHYVQMRAIFFYANRNLQIYNFKDSQPKGTIKYFVTNLKKINKLLFIGHLQILLNKIAFNINCGKRIHWTTYGKLRIE